MKSITYPLPITKAEFAFPKQPTSCGHQQSTGVAFFTPMLWVEQCKNTGAVLLSAYGKESHRVLGEMPTGYHLLSLHEVLDMVENISGVKPRFPELYSTLSEQFLMSF